MTLTASITYLETHPRKPRPHAREGVRTARIFNLTTALLCRELKLTSELAEHLARELSGFDPREGK